MSEGLGFAPSGARVGGGARSAQIQGLGDDDCAFLFWWMVGRQDFVQLELFHYSRPTSRPLAADWAPNELGWVRFGVAVPSLGATIDRLARFGIQPMTDPL